MLIEEDAACLSSFAISCARKRIWEMEVWSEEDCFTAV